LSVALFASATIPALDQLPLKLPVALSSAMLPVAELDQLGALIVIDAPFSPYLADPHFIATTAERFDWPPVDVEVVLVRVCPETLQQRLRERGLERDGDARRCLCTRCDSWVGSDRS